MQGLSDRVQIRRRTFTGPDTEGRTTTEDVTKTIAARIYSAAAIESRRANRYIADSDLVIDAEIWAEVAPEDRVIIDPPDTRAGTYEVQAVESFPPHTARIYVKARP